MTISVGTGPIVFLVLIIILMAVVLGLLFTNTVLFNPERASQQAIAYATREALSAQARTFELSLTGTALAGQAAIQQTQTANNIEATQTPHAATIQAAGIPPQQTATMAALQARAIQLQVQATEIAMQNEARQVQMSTMATATRVNQMMTEDAYKATAEVISNDRQVAWQQVHNIADLALIIAACLCLIAVSGSAGYWLIAQLRIEQVRQRTRQQAFPATQLSGTTD